MSRWIPTRIDGKIRTIAWLSLISEVTIIGTGGAVRLTGSGLGCPTWPACTPGSLIPTSEMGIHGVIEFANRLMTGVIGIIAIVAVILLWNLRRERRDLFVLSLVLIGGIVAQALVGGVTVLTGLNPFIVGFHYIASLLMVCVAAVLVYRVYSPVGARTRIVPVVVLALTHATSFFVAITIAVGVLTTASGPHSGDIDAGRSGFNVELLEHLHAWPAYVMFFLTLVLLAVSAARRLPVRRWVAVLLLVEIAQIAIGLVQANFGLPAVLVGTHMVLASILAAVMTVTILSLKKVTDAPGTESAASASTEPVLSNH
ncbi:heme A synthase [Cryobacterium melibiosiphilum]|uniref:Heme A synthase n=1 Tax=Cryobacterium melibiosiphilum TaxID=995039 RepID=A0A3A5MJD7_9MICO|nr:COX15/CtaA family protein [Cryobacterium melibiosiphilum]RJT87158.1 heme A synthase [Cryobacterium melibiosiphilum]